jgi:exodeoxyribonuclease V alpha subunit
MYPKHKIALCAPTGRAAQRMSESTGMEATTVHRLLDYRPYGDTPSCKDRNNPIDADFIIVDEVSMTDIALFDMLLEAVKDNTMVLLVGDIHQLESVGPGAVLRDLLECSSTIIPRIMLTEVFRQKGGSPIIENAMRINDGNIHMVEAPEFKIIKTKCPEQSLEVIQRLMHEMYDPRNPFETQILCPARKGLAGINNLNTVLQRQLNPSNQCLHFGQTEFRPNDKILMTENNYEAGYYNGDIGIIKTITPSGILVDIRDQDFLIPKSELHNMRLSYGLTIHKSQGSEFKNVIVSMPMDPPGMLVRNLFYTGVTRAKKNVIIVNEGTSMQTSIKVANEGSRGRRTLLKGFIEKYWDRMNS